MRVRLSFFTLPFHLIVCISSCTAGTTNVDMIYPNENKFNREQVLQGLSEICYLSAKVMTAVNLGNDKINLLSFV